MMLEGIHSERRIKEILFIDNCCLIDQFELEADVDIVESNRKNPRGIENGCV